MKRSLLLAVALLFPSVSSFAEVAGERPVSTIEYGSAPGQRYGTVAASDGRDFLVVWIDAQRNRAGVTQLYAARMNAAGEILDPLGIKIPASRQTTGSGVVFLGEAFLVYWTEPSPVSPGWSALMAVRISRDGILLDAAPRMLADRMHAGLLRAASNGNRTVIVFHGPSNSLIIVLDRDGNVVIEPRTFTNFGVSTAMVASNGSGFLVAWTVDGTYATRLDANGVVEPLPRIELSSSRSLFDIASDGDSYVAIVGDPALTVAAQHVSADGGLLERSAVPMQQVFPGFVFSSGSYVLMDGDPLGNTIGVHHLDRTGKPIGTYLPLASAVAYGAGGTLASNGSDTAFFWTEWNNSAQSFKGGVLHPNAAALTTPVAVARSAKAQYAPRAATNGRTLAVAWTETDGTYVGRLTLTGQLLDGRGIRVGGRALAGPDIVFDGSNYLIGWIESSGGAAAVKVARVSPDLGTLIDASGITMAFVLCANGFALAAGSGSTLVTWSDCTHIVADTIDRNGILGTATIVTPSETKGTASVSAAWNEHEWLVAWEDLIPWEAYFDFPSYDTYLKAARLSPSLTLLDPRPISLTDAPSAYGPLVASDGNDFLVVRDGVYAQRLSSDGSLLAGGRIASGRAKSVVWDGQQYAIAIASSGYEVPSTLYVTHVKASGPIEGSAPQVIISNVVDSGAALVVTEPGNVIAAYSRVASEAPYGDVERLFLGTPHAIRGRAVR